MSLQVGTSDGRQANQEKQREAERRKKEKALAKVRPSSFHWSARQVVHTRQSHSLRVLPACFPKLLCPSHKPTLSA